uniref:Thioesterase domain-containing protein n=1 Tax=Aegilops tauschii TaxID=37682 RepID=M8CB42_AEGTA
MRVRDDDLDEYGVVNNAVHASYIHDARNVLLETLGISIHFWTSTGNTMALSELHLKYFTPLRSGGRFIVKLRVVQIKGVRIIVDHVIETLPNRRYGSQCNRCLPRQKPPSNSRIPGVGVQDTSVFFM